MVHRLKKPSIVGESMSAKQCESRAAKDKGKKVTIISLTKTLMKPPSLMNPQSKTSMLPLRQH